MHFNIQNLLFAASLFSFGNAQPAPAKRQVNSNFCNTVRQNIRAATQGPSATAYCSSYLKIPASTVTSTTGTTTITTGRTLTIVKKTTITTGNAGTTTVTTTVSSGTSTVTGSTCDAQNQKRQASPTVPRPSALKSYSSGAPLSSACKCLSIGTSTTTTSVKATATTNPTTTITSTKTVQGTTSVTSTSTVTVPAGTTSTNIPAASCTPIVKDPSFEACPSSDLDTDDATYDQWTIAGAVQFGSTGTDGYTTPYGSQFAYFKGNEDRTAQLTQPFNVIGNMVQGQTYTLSLAYRVVLNNGVTSGYGCYLNSDFALQGEIYHRDFTSSDAPGGWVNVNSNFQYPYDDSAQFDINMVCPYDQVNVLVDNVQITPAGN